MEGIDVVISPLNVFQVDNQYELIDAAKAAGVKRFIPSDFGTTYVRGKSQMYDQVCFYFSQMSKDTD